MRENMNKIIVLLGLLGFGFSAYAEPVQQVVPAKTASQVVNIEVYRSPSCSCCGKWVAHLRENQFQVKDIVTENVQVIKDKYGVTSEMASCHTALVNGYVIEGHVPANDIKKLLKLKADVIGIAVPAMPVGTPGMENNGKKDAYNVISFDKTKQHKVFSHYAEQ
jgi:hypothetical protein